MIRAIARFKIFGCVLDESSTDVAKCHREGVNGRKFAGAIRSHFNSRGVAARGIAHASSVE